MKRNPVTDLLPVVLGAIALALGGCPDDESPGSPADTAGDATTDGTGDVVGDATGDTGGGGAGSDGGAAGDVPHGDQCVGDGDCAGFFGAEDPCREARCKVGWCVLVPGEDGRACGDDPCVGGSVCAAGACQPGEPVSCDDGNPCTQDECAEGIGCITLETGGPCDDGDSCTSGDTCAGGGCVGAPLPGCEVAECGDGICGASESCASCPADCSPAGAGTCGGACDPTEMAPCGDNQACVPSGAEGTAADALAWGHGVCGHGCVSDVDCPGGTCVLVEGLETPGLCAAACEEGTCPDGETCFPRDDDPGQGRCLAAVACDAPGGGCPCHAVTGLAAATLCLQGCYTQSAATCGAGACIPRAGAAWHTGTCVAQASPCSPSAQTGCGQGQTCDVIAGAGIAGVAVVCADATGHGASGEPCGPGEGCEAGLLCEAGLCETPCDPAAGCAVGACVDVSEGNGLPAGSLGACAPSCGDGVCDEDCAACPLDCGCPPACGDGYCTGDEDCALCPSDCGGCPECGDGVCSGDEGCPSCPVDCGPCAVCGDGVCDPGELCLDCPDDCGSCEGVCGDGVCALLESCVSCSADCGSCSTSCGDGICLAPESCTTCTEDCGACEGVCGDGTCSIWESCFSCPSDCDWVGAAMCGGACDPMGAPTGCSPDRVCVPTLLGDIHWDAFSFGNGVCGEGCEGDSDCPGGRCLLLSGFDAPGLCGAPCDGLAGTGCPTGQLCVPGSPDPQAGVCAPGPLCAWHTDCSGPAWRACAALPGADLGVCLPACAVQASTCTGACIGRTGEQWHTGTCAGGTPCEVTAQTGCGAEQTCLPLGGGPIGGASSVCSASTGVLTAGAPCEPDAPCAPGILCYGSVCAEPCLPGAGGCAGGQACADVGDTWNLPPGELGVCGGQP